MFALPTASMSQPNGNGNGTALILRRDTTDPETFRDAVWGRVFNYRRDESRQPRAVVIALKLEHVKEAIELAEKESCRVSVRSGGHSWAAWSVRHDVILIDLGELKDLDYDEESKIVSCSPSVTGRVLNGFLNAKGRVFPGGHCPDVGVGGFLLQGGMGWNCKVGILESHSHKTDRQLTSSDLRTGVGPANMSTASTS